MIVLTLFPGSGASPGPIDQATPGWERTRGLSPSAQALLLEGARRSSIVRGLLASLEQSDLIVSVADAMPGAFSGPASYLSLTHDGGSSRHVVIRLDRFRLSPHERIAWLAHELQHALEVAAAAEVRDNEGLIRLYRRIGWEGAPNRFETLKARDAGTRVRNELLGSGL